MYRTPTEGIDYSTKDYDGFKELLIKTLQKKMPEYTDISETDAGIVILEALANGLDILSLYQDIIANDVFLPTTQDRSIAVMIAKCLGYIPKNQTAGEYPQVFILGSKAPAGGIIIPEGTVVKTVETDDTDSIYFETTKDLLIPEGCYGNEKDDSGNYLYTVTVVQGESIEDEVIGTSTGAPLQVFELNYSNVLLDTLRVYVEEEAEKSPVLWNRVDSFINSEPDSRDYVAMVDEYGVCSIQFGNNSKGLIPPSGVSNNITADYKIGGGTDNNVLEGQITELDDDIDFGEVDDIDVIKTFNLNATKLGQDKESIESIKENAPITFRIRDSLVTLADYEDALRINFDDILEVKAIRADKDKILLHKGEYFRVNLYIMPAIQNDSFDTDLVNSFIDKRQMIGASHNFYPYVEEKVTLNISLYTNDDYNTDDLKEQTDALLKSNYGYGSFTFDDPIIISEIESKIKENVEGVLAVRVNVINNTTKEEYNTAIIYPSKEQYVFCIDTDNLSISVNVM